MTELYEIIEAIDSNLVPGSETHKRMVSFLYLLVITECDHRDFKKLGNIYHYCVGKSPLDWRFYNRTGFLGNEARDLFDYCINGSMFGSIASTIVKITYRRTHYPPFQEQATNLLHLFFPEILFI
jgi:hypothetical protein